MRRRIIVCLGLLLVLCVIGDAIAMLCLDRSIRQISELAEHHRIQTLRAQLTTVTTRIEMDALAQIAAHEHPLERPSVSEQRLADALQGCMGCHHRPDIRAELEEVDQAYRVYQRARGQRLSDEDPATRQARVRATVESASHLVDLASTLDNRASEHLAVRSSDAAASIRNAWQVLLATLAAVLVFGGVVAVHLKRRLTRPVETLLAGIERVRGGATPQAVEVTGDEEFRALGSALNEAYADLRNAQDHVLQAEKLAAIGRLAAGVAHEIGNPLASISSIAQVMRRQGDSNGQAERVDALMDQVGRISRIVRDLLSFARRPKEEEHNVIDLVPLLERAVTFLAYDKRTKQIRIVREYGDGAHMIRGDADRLLLVFTNIILNALDALKGSEEGVLTITLWAENDAVAVRFRDNGPGMTEEQLVRAFEPFYTTKDPGAGTGLGLWICYQVVRRHAGSIDIDSLPGQGATVTLRMPAYSAEEPLDVGDRAAARLSA